MKNDRKQRGEGGWWAGLGWTVADTYVRAGLNLDSWNALSLDARYELIAYYKVKDTMDVWESYQARKKRK